VGEICPMFTSLVGLETSTARSSPDWPNDGPVSRRSDGLGVGATDDLMEALKFRWPFSLPFRNP
jgi:hypothetical protein